MTSQRMHRGFHRPAVIFGASLALPRACSRNSPAGSISWHPPVPVHLTLHRVQAGSTIVVSHMQSVHVTTSSRRRLLALLRIVHVDPRSRKAVGSRCVALCRVMEPIAVSVRCQPRFEGPRRVPAYPDP